MRSHSLDRGPSIHVSKWTLVPNLKKFPYDNFTFTRTDKKTIMLFTYSGCTVNMPLKTHLGSQFVLLLYIKYFFRSMVV